MRTRGRITFRAQWCRSAPCVAILGLAVLPGVLQAQETVKRQIAVKTVVAPAKMHEEPLVAVIEIAQATTLPATFTASDHSELNRISGDLESGNLDRAVNRWQRFVEQLEKSRDEASINSLVQFVLRQSYVETNEDLQFHAEKVEAFNYAKEEIREHMSELRAALGATPREAPVRVQTIVVATPYEEGQVRVRQGPRKEMSDREIAEYVLELADKLQAIGEDGQLANIDLQNALQKQQQTLQTISNVSKMLHDTAMAVIRKIR